MEFRVLKYFLMTARLGSMTKAAQSLHITQPTLSRQIAELEEETGVHLFERGNRRLVLTEEGHLLRRRAEEMMELMEKTEEELSSSEKKLRGCIMVGGGELMVTERFASLIFAFQKQHPFVRFNYFTGTTDEIDERMNHGLIDAAILVCPFDTETFDYISLGPDARWGVYLRTDDVLASKDHIKPSDLHGRAQQKKAEKGNHQLAGGGVPEYDRPGDRESGRQCGTLRGSIRLLRPVFRRGRAYVRREETEVYSFNSGAPYPDCHCLEEECTPHAGGEGISPFL